MEISITVTSRSSGNIYNVNLSNENGLLRFNCSCPTGNSKGICRHRTSLIEGDVSEISDSDAVILSEFLSTLDKSKIDSFFKERDRQQNEIDKEIKKLKKKRAEIGVVFGKRFCDGF